MNNPPGDELVRAMFESAIAGGTPIFDIPDIPDGQPLAKEWKAFCSELPRLIAAGHKGRFAVVKGDRVESIWDTQRDALQAGRQQFGQEAFLLQEIQWFVRSQRWGYRRPCPD
jgi:hypothetical protein